MEGGAVAPLESKSRQNYHSAMSGICFFVIFKIILTLILQSFGALFPKESKVEFIWRIGQIYC